MKHTKNGTEVFIPKNIGYTTLIYQAFIVNFVVDLVFLCLLR